LSFLVPVVAGLGLILIYNGLTAPPKDADARPLRKLEDLIAEAGLARLSSGRFLVLGVLSVGITFVVVAGITTSVVVAGSAGLVIASVPLSLLKARRDRRRRRFREAWPDAIASLIAAVRSGTSLAEACISLTARGPVELRGGFNAFAATYRASGSFDAALERMRLDLADPIADRVTLALKVANDVGGSDLVRVLRTLAEFIRDDLRVRREIQARWSWTVTAARVAAAAPWLVLIMMSTRSEAAAAFDSPAGLLVIVSGAIATLLGYRLMLRAGRLPEERRLP
jgi:tight adherence protein B